MQIKTNLSKYAPTALSILGSVSVIGVTVLTAFRTKDAVLKVNKIEMNRGKKMTAKEVVKTVAPIYIPVVALDVAAIACIMGANALNVRQQASLMSAYALTERAYSQYKTKVKETFGEEAHDKIISDISVEDAKQPHISTCGAFETTTLDFDESDTEKHLFYDKFSMRYFNATFAQVLQAEYHLNRNFVLDAGQNYVNQFYEFLGIEPVAAYESHGWFVSDEFYWIDFNHVKTVMDDGLEVWIVEMVQEPMPYQVWEQIYDGCY